MAAGEDSLARLMREVEAVLREAGRSSLVREWIERLMDPPEVKLLRGVEVNPDDTLVFDAEKPQLDLELKRLRRIVHNSAEHSASIVDYVSREIEKAKEETGRSKKNLKHIKRLAVIMRDSLGQTAKLLNGEDLDEQHSQQIASDWQEIDLIEPWANWADEWPGEPTVGLPAYAFGKPSVIKAKKDGKPGVVGEFSKQWEPDGDTYLLPEGGLLAKRDYPELYAVLRDRFTPHHERDGEFFRIPDLRGRVVPADGSLHHRHTMPDPPPFGMVAPPLDPYFPDPAVKALDEAKIMLADVHTKIRGLAKGVRAGVLTSDGIAAELEGIARDIRGDNNG